MLKTTLFLLSFSLFTFAAPKPDQQFTFNNKDCLKTESCDLKEFQLKVYHKQHSYNSFVEGYYETKSLASMEKYAVVQFIKGCVYETHLRNEKIEFQRYLIRDFFGNRSASFIHKNWEVDSFDQDPIYKSLYNRGKSRHGGYKVLKDHSKSVIFDDSSNHEHYIFKPEMNRSRLYFSDMPTGGDIGSIIKVGAGERIGDQVQSFRSSSLKFKTCLFKTSDVAIDAGKDGVNINKAIQCFDWASSYIADPITKQISSPKEIAPYCSN